MYEEKQILNIATNRNQRGLKCFILNAINSGVRQTDTLAAKQTKAFE